MIVLKPLDYKPLATYEDPLATRLDGTYMQPFATIVNKIEDGKARIDISYVKLPVAMMHIMADEAEKERKKIDTQLELYTSLSKMYE